MFFQLRWIFFSHKTQKVPSLHWLQFPALCSHSWFSNTLLWLLMGSFLHWKGKYRHYSLLFAMIIIITPSAYSRHSTCQWLSHNWLILAKMAKKDARTFPWLTWLSYSPLDPTTAMLWKDLNTPLLCSIKQAIFIA